MGARKSRPATRGDKSAKFLTSRRGQQACSWIASHGVLFIVCSRRLPCVSLLPDLLCNETANLCRYQLYRFEMWLVCTVLYQIQNAYHANDN